MHDENRNKEIIIASFLFGLVLVFGAGASASHWIGDKLWSVDYVTPPTPVNGTSLNDHVVNISVLVSPTLKEAALKTMFHASSGFTGNLSNTMLNTSDNSLQLAYPALTGTYTSPIYEFESNVLWGNMSWTDSLSADGGFEAQNGLAGLWRMNQETSPVLDYSGNGNDGVCSGTACPALTIGKRGKALSFDGNDDYLAVNAGSSLDMADSMTVSAWVKPDGFAKNYNSIAGRTDNGNWGQGWGFYYLSSTMNFWINGWNTNVASIPFSDTSSWHYVVGVYNGSAISIYIDGIKGEDDAYSGNVANIGNLEIGRNTHYVDSTQNYYWNGSIDEVMIWNRSLSAEEILDSYNSLMANATFQMRSCDDDACAGEDFVGSSGAGSYYTNAEYESLNNLQPNKWFQYKALLNAKSANFTSKLYNVSMKGIASSYYEDVTISKAWIDFNGGIYSMSGSGYSWSYANNTLDKGGYTYRVYVNDSFGNVNATETRVFSVPSYEITFNVIDADDGSGINEIEINCDYTGFNQNEDTTPYENPYGSYEFPVGGWVCNFVDSVSPARYWNETKSFTAIEDTTLNVSISSKGGLSYEEHTMLDWLYRCWKYGECDAYTKLSGVYENVSRIWNEYIPTNISVVANETFISKTLSPTSNITIDYNVSIPYKKGVEDKALLPIRLFYWFTNTSGVCYNQDKQADSNTAETPFCIPLMAEYLGPNNGSASFRVELDPSLPDGIYEVVRQIDIDPPVNGVQTWINYGREKIGSIIISNPLKTDENSASESTSPEVVQAKAPTLPKLQEITSEGILDVKGTGSVPVLIGLGMICITIISSIYIRSRYK